MKKLTIKYGYLIIGILAFFYYLALCAKSWTWVFTSSDSGDWIASSIWWFNSQPYGSPLYVLLGHLMNWLFPDHLVLALTIGLSVVPASITVATTYLIIKKLTNIKYAFIGVVILLSSAIFLTQSTILEEYALSCMFITLAYYFYILEKRKLTVLMLALGTAVHAIAGLISLIWLISHSGMLKEWFKTYWKQKTFWIYVVFGILPYSMVLILMAMDNPKILAGNLTFMGILNYIGATGTIGTISWYETFKRILPFLGFMCLCLGLAIVPFISMLKKFSVKHIQTAILTVVTCMWLYATNSDPNTWTFLYLGIPIMVILAILGLRNLKHYHTKIVLTFSVVMLIFNSFFLNADVLTKEYPVASKFEKSTIDLPDGSVVLTLMSGGYLLGLLRMQAGGKNIIPLGFSGDYPDAEKKAAKTVRYKDYKKWFEKTYHIYGGSVKEQIQYVLNKKINIYVPKNEVTQEWQEVLIIDAYDDVYNRVVGVK